MALNVILSDIESERRSITVPTGTAPGTPVIFGGRPMVTITGSGDYTNGLTSTGNDVIDQMLEVGEPNGGVGLQPLEATASPTGTYAFDVTGASVATAKDTPVYLITTGANEGDLTLTAGSNAKFGIVEFFRGETSATDTAVTIGVNLG